MYIVSSYWLKHAFVLSDYEIIWSSISPEGTGRYLRYLLGPSHQWKETLDVTTELSLVRHGWPGPNFQELSEAFPGEKSCASWLK